MTSSLSSAALPPAANKTPDRPRRFGFTTLHQLYCPDGHHIRRDTIVLTDAGIRCKHREPGQARECGGLVYVLACASPRVAPWQDGLPGLAFVAEVAFPELKYVEDQQMDLLTMLQFFGVAWARGPRD